MTTISICQKCKASIIVELNDKEWSHGLKFLCSECANNETGVIVDNEDINNLSKTVAIVPYSNPRILGFGETAEQKALDELRKFCIVGE